MTDAPPSPGRKAIDYAEQQLGVNRVFDEVKEERTKLDDLLTELSSKRDERRMVEELLAEAELNIAADERATHPDMSQAQMDKHLKIAIQRDSGVRGLRDRLRGVHGDIDGLEMDKDIIETNIKIGIARMVELGGYLQYLAVIKLAEENRKNASSVSPGSPIPGW